MRNFLEKAHVRGLAYTLQILLSDAFDQDEIETSFKEMLEQWSDSPEFARTILSDWNMVLAEGDPAVAQYLVKEWANKGCASPEVAISMIRRWYSQFQPLWDRLS